MSRSGTLSSGLSASGSSLRSWVLGANASTHIVTTGIQRLRVDEQKWNSLISYLEKYFTSEKQDELVEWVRTVNASTPLAYDQIWWRDNYRLAITNVWANLRLRLVGSSGSAVEGSSPSAALIRASIERTGLISAKNSFFQQLSDGLSLYFSFIFLASCFAYGTFGIAVLIQDETSKGLKRMQMLMGCHPAVYWGVNFVADFLLFMITVAVVLGVLAIFPNSYSGQLGIITSVVVPYGFMAISFTYLLSFVFKGANGIIIFTIVSFILALVAAAVVGVFGIVYTICEKTNGRDCRFGWSVVVSDIARLHPAYYIVDSLSLITISDFLDNFAGGGPGGASSVIGQLGDFDLQGKRILTAVVAGLVYLVVAVLLEHFDVRVNLSCCEVTSGNLESPLPVTDPDVLEEERRVLSQPGLEEPLVLRRVAKMYPKARLPAVAGVTVGIPGGQCFGLLGINGAGKSTLFKMLTGTLGASGGEAWLGGRSLLGSRGWARLRNTSYCPQENTLFSALSVAQHLELFGRLRGVPGRERGRLAACLLAETGLGGQADKRAGQLSGGNQRKLQLALALLDYPAVVLLDEPTTGMDPGARRAAWAAVSRAVGRGSALVLTSHSMEECEQLCDRLVIMVAGTFHCLGSVQYLKGKFGNQYHFQLKLPSPASPAPVRAAVAEAVPRAVLAEHNATMLHYEVGAAEVVLSELFALLSRLRSQRLLEDFSVNQTNLERVFVKMAAVQQMLQDTAGPQDPLRAAAQPPQLPPAGAMNGGFDGGPEAGLGGPSYYAPPDPQPPLPLHKADESQEPLATSSEANHSRASPTLPPKQAQPGPYAGYGTMRKENEEEPAGVAMRRDSVPVEGAPEETDATQGIRF